MELYSLLKKIAEEGEIGICDGAIGSTLGEWVIVYYFKNGPGMMDFYLLNNEQKFKAIEGFHLGWLFGYFRLSKIKRVLQKRAFKV